MSKAAKESAGFGDLLLSSYRCQGQPRLQRLMLQPLFVSGDNVMIQVSSLMLGLHVFYFDFYSDFARPISQ